MNSYNHYAYGAVCQWLLEGLAGFRPDPEQPAFKHVIFEPTIVPALSPVAAHHDSAAGRIDAGWSVDGDRVTYRVRIPDHASGTLVPAKDWTDIRIDGAAVGRDGDGTKGLPLSAGAHTISFARVKGA